MFDKILKIQNDLDIDLDIELKGRQIIVKDTSFMHLPYYRSYSSVDNLVNDITNLYNQNLLKSENVVELFQRNNEEVEEDQFVDNVLEFSKKEQPLYIMPESDPYKLERAVLCINNIHKSVHDQDESYKKIHKGIIAFNGKL